MFTHLSKLKPSNFPIIYGLDQSNFLIFGRQVSRTDSRIGIFERNPAVGGGFQLDFWGKTIHNPKNGWTLAIYGRYLLIIQVTYPTVPWWHPLQPWSGTWEENTLLSIL